MSNHHTWKLTLRLLKSEVNLNFNNYWFIDILEHLVDYGESNSDLGSALGMVMVSKLDLFGDITDGIDEAPSDGNIIDDMGFYDMVNGELIFKTYGEAEQEKSNSNPFSVHKIRSFDPEFDLEGEEREKFYQMQIKSKDEIKLRRQNVLEKYSGDIMAFTLDEHNKRIEEN